jgi:excisionase family DNA binding protein
MFHRTANYAPARRLLTRQEVADHLGVSTRTITRLLERGELRCVRIGRSTRFRAVDVDALIERALNDERPTGWSGVGRESAEQDRCNRG